MRGVKRALAAGGSVEGIPGDLCLPLMSAASAGHLDMIELLLEKGANVEASIAREWDTERGQLYPLGTRALHAAAYVGEVDILRALPGLVLSQTRKMPLGVLR